MNQLQNYKRSSHQKYNASPISPINAPTIKFPNTYLCDSNLKDCKIISYKFINVSTSNR